ncbi:uroporphyrinogen-III C-methyltransferase [Thalassotalea litorea]|uniref:uroporphyrinogen-III C-methyltransferase n=1 Tax=Thalassotalea litorea TaxID=2020715 RepID=A0A5R9IE63_9GAMM|nr:uroporphyrinogen-III C-methyltransferase [Thalassotalea litorea]TLU61663.1 uroporphyrinogen-III C-methyltransferase [Thalassotalea litorea]
MQLPASKSNFKPGEIALIGAGPGDAELLTVKAVRFLQHADVVVYDRLVSRDILNLLPDNARRIYVGKELNRHSVPQEKINETLVELARKQMRVVRLKGGDSFIFGRGSEELNYILEQQVSAHVIPGITAASGCTTYAGIPLTHRGLAHSCSFITGHFSKDGELILPWQNYIDSGQTLVFYMGIKSSATIAKQLIKHGRAPSTPAAIIHSGTQNNQKVWRTTLQTLPTLIANEEVKSPSLLVIGDVVNAVQIAQQAPLTAKMNPISANAYFSPAPVPIDRTA